MQTLQIQLLGYLQLSYGNQPATKITGARLQAFLAYLLIHHERAHSRYQLATLFWPGSEIDQARSNLRNKLNILREKFPALDEFLYVDDDILRWRADAPFTLDIVEFEAALQRAEQSRRHQDQTGMLTALKAAVALYTDDLLTKLHDDWILAERQRLRNQFLAALNSLVTLCKQRAEFDEAIYYANRLCQVNPLNEAAHQQLMELHLLNEDPVNALRSYEICKEILQRSAKVAPSPTTEQIYKRSLTAVTASSLGSAPSLLPTSVLPAHSMQAVQALAAGWFTTEPQRHFPGITCFLARLATLLGNMGQFDEALHLLDQAFTLLTTTRESFWEAELHRLRGKLLWRQGKPLVEVETAFRKALLIARQQNTKFQELCALGNLYLLWQHTDKAGDARRQLAELYPFFHSNPTQENLEAFLVLLKDSL